MILDPFVLIDVGTEEGQRHTWEYTRANGIDAINKDAKQIWIRGIFRWFQAIWAYYTGVKGGQPAPVSFVVLRGFMGFTPDTKELSGKLIRRGEIPWRPTRFGRG